MIVYFAINELMNKYVQLSKKINNRFCIFKNRLPVFKVIIGKPIVISHH